MMLLLCCERGPLLLVWRSAEADDCVLSSSDQMRGRLRRFDLEPRLLCHLDKGHPHVVDREGDHCQLWADLRGGTPGQGDKCHHHSGPDQESQNCHCQSLFSTSPV